LPGIEYQSEVAIRRWVSLPETPASDWLP
jgi:hypothetical protein